MIPYYNFLVLVIISFDPTTGLTHQEIQADDQTGIDLTNKSPRRENKGETIVSMSLVTTDASFLYILSSQNHLKGHKINSVCTLTTK